MARRLGISRAHASRLNASGRLPRAIRLGRSTRWNAEDLTRWALAGCPSRDRWEVLR
ncbi:MAG: helix-turn-helix domain-containing protein [Planctomycetes bacterium]|nr:helix-turn-helix domain-containing protein [Planctomycetota bacterium]